MNCGLVDARIDGRGVDVNSVELTKNVRLILDRHPADLDAILSRIGQCALVPKQQKGAGLGFDACIRALRLYAYDRPQIVGNDPPLEKALLRLDVVEQLTGDIRCVEGVLIEAEVYVVLLRVGQVGKIGQATDGVGIIVFHPIRRDLEYDNLAIDFELIWLARAGEEQRYQRIAGDVEQPRWQTIMLHPHETVETIVIAMELIMMSDQQLLAEPVLAGHELPVAIVPFAQQGRRQLIACVTVPPEEGLGPHLRRRAIKQLKKPLHAVGVADNILVARWRLDFCAVVGRNGLCCDDLAKSWLGRSQPVEDVTSIAFADGPMGSIELELIRAKHRARSLDILEIDLSEVGHRLEGSRDLFASGIDAGNSAVFDEHGDGVSARLDLAAQECRQLFQEGDRGAV